MPPTHLGTGVILQIAHTLLLTVILDKLPLPTFLLFLPFVQAFFLEIQLPIFPFIQIEHLPPDILVDVERGVSVCLGTQSVQQLLLDRLLKVRGGESFAFSSSLSTVELLLDSDELGSEVSRDREARSCPVTTQGNLGICKIDTYC